MNLNVKMFVELPALIKKSADEKDTEFIKLNMSVNPLKVSFIRPDMNNSQICFIQIDNIALVINLPYEEVMQKINM